MRSRALLVLAGCVIAILAVGEAARPRSMPAPTPAPSTVGASPSPSNSAAPSVGPSTAVTVGASAIVEAFMAVYAAPPADPAQRPAWDARIAALSTPDLAEGLRLADVERLPRGTVVAITVLEDGDDAQALAADLDSGERYIVTVEPQSAQWAVSDVRPAQ